MRLVDAEELPEYLDRLRLRVIDQGPRAAASAMVQAFDKGIKSDELIRFSGHPSPAGSPPALETGRLRDSLKIIPAAPAGAYRWRSSDAPHTVYARIQEYGGDIYPRVKRFLHWVDAGGSHFAKHARLPARPYMRPAIRRMVAHDILHDRAHEAFNAEVFGE
jgi:hypothetical protein